MKKMKKGFTIVELVIVIAVIGILSAILIPTFSNVTDDANKKAAVANARNEIINAIDTETGEVGIDDAVYLDANKYYVLIVDGNVSGDATKDADTIIAAAEGAGLDVAAYKGDSPTKTFAEGVNLLDEATA